MSEYVMMFVLYFIGHAAFAYILSSFIDGVTVAIIMLIIIATYVLVACHFIVDKLKEKD